MARKRLRSEDERERRTQDAPPPQQHALLELQQGAGNRAVSAMLARESDTKEKEKPKAPPATGTRAIFPGIGTIPLESVQFSGSRRPDTSRRREKGEKEDKSGEITVTSKSGAHTSDLFKASLDGKPVTIEIVIAGSGGDIRFKLKGAMITNLSLHEDLESWTLHFEEMEQEVERVESEQGE